MGMEYDVVFEAGGKSLRIDWGNSPGWKDKYADFIGKAERISLVPKQKGRVVTVVLDGNKRWIVFSRVFGQAGSSRTVRLHCIGWQVTVGGRNVQSKTWVYPDGTIENSPDPTLWRKFTG